MDRITKSLFDDFVATNHFQGMEESEAFEHFASTIVTSQHYPETFDSTDIHTGGGSDCGIDAIAIIVNGSLITEPEEVDSLAEMNGFLDVTFVFCQAERSAAFDSAKIGNFSFGIGDFFSESPKLPRNDDIAHAARIVSELYSRSRLFKKGNPSCHLYYVTTGKWVSDPQLETRRESAVRDLEALNIFGATSFVCVDADHIRRLVLTSQNSIRREIVFPERAVAPDLIGVDQAYIGLLPVDQFFHLIETEAGEIIPSLFDDNVRHWQEWNVVNEGIRETLRDRNRAALFPLLNNGVTVIAKRISPTGKKFLLEDYQIVNGCQTSFVLHQCKNELASDSIMLPLRLIATEDEEIRNAIIKATNRQTAVSEDQLVALSDYPRKLEAFFATFEGRKRLYFERRSRQYSGASGVEKVRVVSMAQLLRAYAAMFQSIPHRTTKNYRTLLNNVGRDIFGADHRPEQY